MGAKRYTAWWGPAALIVAVALIVVMVVGKRNGAGERFHQTIAAATVTGQNASAGADGGTSTSRADGDRREAVMPSSTRTKAQLPDGFSYTWVPKGGDVPGLPNPCEPIQYTVSNAPDGVEAAIDDTFKRIAKVNGMEFRKMAKESELSQDTAITTYQFLFQTTEQDAKLTDGEDFYAESIQIATDVPTLHEVKAHMLKGKYQQASSVRWVVFWILGLSSSRNILDFSDAGDRALQAIVRECPA